MKKLLAILAISFTLFSCDEAKPTEPTVTPANNANSPINDAKLTDSSAMKENAPKMEAKPAETKSDADATKKSADKMQ